jgi:Mce-associated membrane protein
MNHEDGDSMTDRTGTPLWAGKPFLAGLSALTVVALVAAVWFGTAWLSGGGGAATTAQARGEAERAGEHAVAVFGTLDYRTVDAGLDEWERMSTGQLNDEVKKSRQAQSQVIKNGKTSTSAKVLSGGLTELDSEGGVAKMIAVAEIVVTPEQGEPVTKRNRFQADLRRTDQGWKLSSIQALAIGG